MPEPCLLWCWLVGNPCGHFLQTGFPCCTSLLQGFSPEWVLEQVSCNGKGKGGAGRVLLEKKESLPVGRHRAWPSKRCLSLMPMSFIVELFPHPCCECPLTISPGPDLILRVPRQTALASALSSLDSSGERTTAVGNGQVERTRCGKSREGTGCLQ